MKPMTEEDRELLQRWVDTWKAAGPELEAIRIQELQSVDTCEAVRQLFGSTYFWADLPSRLTSGLVEQQYWFAKLHRDPAI
jgi:hypothetical protein